MKSQSLAHTRIRTYPIQLQGLPYYVAVGNIYPMHQCICMQVLHVAQSVYREKDCLLARLLSLTCMCIEANPCSVLTKDQVIYWLAHIRILADQQKDVLVALYLDTLSFSFLGSRVFVSFFLILSRVFFFSSSLCQNTLRPKPTLANYNIHQLEYFYLFYI